MYLIQLRPYSNTFILDLGLQNEALYRISARKLRFALNYRPCETLLREWLLFTIQLLLHMDPFIYKLISIYKLLYLILKNLAISLSIRNILCKAEAHKLQLKIYKNIVLVSLTHAFQQGSNNSRKSHGLKVCSLLGSGYFSCSSSVRHRKR